MVSFLGTETSPSSGDFFADDHAEERGLAGAVGSDEADLFAGVQLKGGVDEDKLFAVLLIDAGKRNHWKRIERGGTVFSVARGLFRRGADQEIEAGGVGERPEIPVSRKQRNSAIDTALGDQGIAEARFAALCEHLRSQFAGPLPIAGP